MGEDRGRIPTRFRAVFVSDIHLGSAASKAADFLRFLQAVECDQLYLVGDFIDVWMSVKSGKWRPIDTEVVRQVARMQEQGIKVVYLPGNHDAFLRKVQPMALGGLSVQNKLRHKCLDGRTALVAHGDEQDIAVHSFWLSLLGAWSYEWLTQFSNLIDRHRARKGKQPRFYSQGIKRRMKRTMNRLNNFEKVLSQTAVDEGCEMVICGHNHRPALFDLVEKGVTYANCGDWVENRTALVEHVDGVWELLDWPKAEAVILSAQQASGSQGQGEALKVME